MDYMISITPGKRRLAGCYMWNYGEGQPLTDEQMEYQLEVYLKYIKAGKIEGLVLCSNCIADIGLSAVDIMKRWIDRNGDLIIG